MHSVGLASFDVIASLVGGLKNSVLLCLLDFNSGRWFCNNLCNMYICSLTSNLLSCIEWPLNETTDKKYTDPRLNLNRLDRDFEKRV